MSNAIPVHPDQLQQLIDPFSASRLLPQSSARRARPSVHLLFGDKSMSDVLFTLITTAFFGVALFYVGGCDHL